MVAVARGIVQAGGRLVERLLADRLGQGPYGRNARHGEHHQEQAVLNQVLAPSLHSLRNSFIGFSLWARVRLTLRGAQYGSPRRCRDVLLPGHRASPRIRSCPQRRAGAPM
jgi:hypothetical protein